MNCFTPDLLERFASDDDRIALPAHDELEQRAEQYVEHLNVIANRLPPRLWEMLRRFDLHDAQVVSPPLSLVSPGSPGRWQSLPLVLHLHTPPHNFLVLHYRFVRVDEVRTYPPLTEELPFLEWQHDEVEILPSEGPPEFGHSILFASGLEVKRRFRDFDFATLKPMDLASAQDQAPQATSTS